MENNLNTDKRKSAKRFEEVALPHMDYLYRAAYHLCGNKALAEDLTQETLFIAMQKIDQLKEDAKSKSWMFVIMRNLFWGKLQKERNYYFVNYEDLAYGMPDNSHEAERLWREGFSDEVQHQLDRLDEKYKTPLAMSVLGNYSYKEIAASLKIPIGTVMSRIARGKSFLRREITRAAEAGLQGQAA